MLEGENFPHAATALIAKRLLNRHSPSEIAEAITVLIDVLDVMEPDAEAEPVTWPEDVKARDRTANLHTDLPDDHESGGDDQDAAWLEWQSAHPGTRGQCQTGGEEDDEEDDPSGQCDEDEVNTLFALATGHGPGCKISDDDFEHDGREEQDGY